VVLGDYPTATPLTVNCAPALDRHKASAARVLKLRGARGIGSE
jgi:hypothetical protein